MQFRVFPNYDTFVQRVPIEKKKHYNIKDIYITSNGAFWFITNKNHGYSIVNMNASFVHLHKRTKDIEELQFDYTPFLVTRDNFKYDPKKKQLIIGENIFHWKSPKWIKNIFHWKSPKWIKNIFHWKSPKWVKSIFSPKWVKNIQGSYTGSELPKKKTKIQGDWILDRHEKIIYLILDYAPIVRRNT